MGGQPQAQRICAAALGSFLLGLAALAAQTSDRQRLFPAQSAVVLLAGLPGDVESENTYRDQLQSWLDIVEGSRQAAKIFVLCENPESVTFAANRHDKHSQSQAERSPDHQADGGSHQSSVISYQSPVTVLHADRTNFLSLNESLAAGTNPLVLIAWGHGGRQGNTPVFHVRGPRITPADVKALASRMAAPESRFVLMFPGSGLFASQLAREQRQILSSECETMFSSDPVGMSLLLKLARDEPSLAFEALSEKLGRATAAWYADRSLARTEEPTLWAGTDKPRLLAAASETNSFASARLEETNAPPTVKVSEPEPPPAELPAVWREIKRVEPQKYPEADGVMLRRRCSYTLGSNPAIGTEQEEFIQILTPEGKRFGDFDVAYSPPHEDVNFLNCEVLRPDGKLVRLDPDAIREGGEQSVGDYHLGRRKFFSLPGLVPGAVLRVRYKTEWKTFPLPHVSLEIPIGQELPTLETAIEVSVPKGAPFHFALEQISAADPVIKQTSYGTTYLWRFENLPAHEREILVSPRQRSRLLISTFPDWPAFAEWYARISKLADEVTPEIAAKAKELTWAATGDREKVLALYDYVTSLRYVAVPLGVNSFRPHAAANVLQNQFGDCKDKANLFNTLLRSLSIQARLVLVPRFSQAHEGIPGLAFNHAISRVTLGSETLWVDTTDDVCRFGLLPPGDPGRKVLVIDGQTTTLTQLPPPDPKEHQLTLRGQVNCSGPTETLPVTLNATALGYADYELRETARQAKEQGFSLPLLAAKFRPVAGSFAMQNQKASALSALDEDFTWKADGVWIGGCSAAGGVRWLHSPFWLPKEWELALHRRKAGLFLNQGYPLTLEEEFQFTLPPESQPKFLPGVSENTAAPLRWHIEWTRIGNDKLLARLRAELVRGEFSAAETLALQNQLRQMLSALAVSASWSVPP